MIFEPKTFHDSIIKGTQRDGLFSVTWNPGFRGRDYNLEGVSLVTPSLPVAATEPVVSLQRLPEMINYKRPSVNVR